MLAFTGVHIGRFHLGGDTYRSQMEFGLFTCSAPGCLTQWEPGRGKWSRIKKLWHGCVEAQWDPGRREWSTIEELWGDYLRYDNRQCRLRRLVPLGLLYVLLSICLSFPFGRIYTPLRVDLSAVTNKFVLFGSVFLFIILVLYVFDVSLYCQKFIDCSSQQHPDWTHIPEKVNSQSMESAVKDMIKEWLLIKLIARRTDAIGRMIFYPFIVWSVMFIARNHYFDNWIMQTGLLLVFVLSLAFAWSSALMLRKAAERARNKAINRLREKILKNCSGNMEQVARVQTILDEIRSIEEGAFLPFMQHPLVKALLIPFSGVGGAYLLDLLEKTGR